MTNRQARWSSLRRSAGAPGRAQAGAATLIVIMILFFVMSLTAAYTSRNLIFEQRTSANQYKSTQSFEATEAGIEWTLAMLNSGGIDNNCLPDPLQGNFRQRYLNTNTTIGADLGKIFPRLQAGGATLWAACSFDGANWQCKCPTSSLAAADLPAGKAAFAIRFVGQITKPGLVRLEVNGCSSYDLACLQFINPTLDDTYCRSSACTMLALFGGAKLSPNAAVTSRQGVSGTSLAVYNQSVEAGGITVHSGGAAVSTLVLGGIPGTPPLLTVRPNDATLSGLAADSDDCTLCMFSSIFGLRPATFDRLMGVLRLTCNTPCNASDVNGALATSRGRVVSLAGAGGLTLNDPADVIGSALDPVVLKIDGPLTIAATAGSTARIHGLVYAASAAVDAGEIRGALVSASTVTGDGTGRIAYDSDALARSRLTTGSFVRIPGSWRDHP